MSVCFIMRPIARCECVCVLSRCLLSGVNECVFYHNAFCQVCLNSLFHVFSCVVTELSVF